jgi:hypothetical protein
VLFVPVRSAEIPEAAVTATVECLCRARLGGRPCRVSGEPGRSALAATAANPLYKTYFERQAAQYKKDGYLFVDIYVRVIRLYQGIRQA